MNISIFSCEKGASQAKGITVIIDVFRAFTLEAYLFAKGAKKIYAVASEAEARQLKQEHPEYLLIGERKGRKLPGFDFGNSPDAVKDSQFPGCVFVHTTTNGTQGIEAALNASLILTGSLVNASATASYISQMHPEDVSLVAMGWEGRETEEDLLCAEYLRSLLLEQPLADIAQKADDLRRSEGKKFFDPLQQDVFPQGDFNMCVQPDLFSFAIQVETENGNKVCRKKDVHA